MLWLEILSRPFNFFLLKVEISYRCTMITEFMHILLGLCRYGGIYLDSDIVVLQPLLSLNNTVGLENEHSGSNLNGAVMAFRKHRYCIYICESDRKHVTWTCIL